MDLGAPFPGPLIEEEEERSDLEKIQDLFHFETAAYALEMAEAIDLPDGPELQAMKRAVEIIKQFLALFEFPASAHRDRSDAQFKLYDDMHDAMTVAVPQHHKTLLSGAPGFGATGADKMYDELSRAYINVLNVLSVRSLSPAAKKMRHPIPQAHSEEWLNRAVKDAATWAGAPMPKIPEEWPPK